MDINKLLNGPVRPYAAIIRSKTLKEDIIALKDRDKLEETMSEYPGLVIYSPAEINKMYMFRGAPSAIMAIHAVKKTFNGRIY